MMLERSDIAKNRLLYSIDTEIAPTDEEIAEYDAILARGEKLPDDVIVMEAQSTPYLTETKYAKIKRSELSYEEINQFLHFEQLHYLRSIKRWVRFIGIIFVLILSAILLPRIIYG